MHKHICIHGHFYQPPRENPWLEEIECQDSAYPYHDWNERVTGECYAPNAASRILGFDGTIINIVNNYSKISFDFGPTLLPWLEKHRPHVYAAIIEADRMSIERFSGHGSAIAHAYNHMILPLANRKDKYTQIIWGVRDFEKRFKRGPEGMWLPETAVDKETLEVLVSLGIKFTILAPGQSSKIRPANDPMEWKNVSDENIDSTNPYLCILPSGRSITVFFYDGSISREVSFRGLLNNGEMFAKRLLEGFPPEGEGPRLVHIATDGETFGHHHRNGDMALSYALHYIESQGLAVLTNYGEYLEKNAPDQVVEIFDNSSWSCVHGVERWRSDCGCNTGMHELWNQQWRKPLREALDWLRDELLSVYLNSASMYMRTPWEARNEFIEVILDRSFDNVEGFLQKHTVKSLSPEEKVRVLKLLEIQRNAMLMYTSCGWFFDDVSGMETIQVIKYASKALQYAEEFSDTPLEPRFLDMLHKVPSNVFTDAAELYYKFVNSAKIDLLRVGAHFSISSIFEEYPDPTDIYNYSAISDEYDKRGTGKLYMAMGKSRIISSITWEKKTISFAVLHLGDHNINSGVKEFAGDEDHNILKAEILEAFDKGDVPEVIRLLDRHFNEKIFSLWHLFRDQQRKVLNQILQLTYENVETSYRQIYDNNYAIMNFYCSLQQQLPRPLFSAAEYVINTDLKRLFEEDMNTEKLTQLIGEAQRWKIRIDMTTMNFVISLWVNHLMERLAKKPENSDLLNLLNNTLEILAPMSFSLNVREAQNIYFSLGRQTYPSMKEKSEKNESHAIQWVEKFMNLGNHLHVRI